MSTELERLAAGGPQAGEEPPATPSVVAATFEGGAANVDAAWVRVREVLEIMAEPRRPWPATGEWKALLPAWFVDSCSDDVTIVNCVLDKWSIRAWVYWFQPDQRRWLFWSRAAGDSELAVTVIPTGQGSLLLGSLEWLMKCAGGRLSTSS